MSLCTITARLSTDPPYERSWNSDDEMPWPEVTEVYCTYDRIPYFFSCRYAVDGAYFCQWFWKEGAADFWMGVDVTLAELERIEQGRQDLHTTFGSDRDKWLFSDVRDVGRGMAPVDAFPASCIPKPGVLLVKVPDHNFEE